MVKVLDMENLAARLRGTAGFRLENRVIDGTERQEKERASAQKR